MSSRIAIAPVNSPRQVLFASLVGTTIEYFDFYIYGTAALRPYLRFYNHQRPHASLGRHSPWRRFQEAA